MGQREARSRALGPDGPGAPIGVYGLLPLAQFLKRIGKGEYGFERAGILMGDEAQVRKRALEVAGFDIHQGQKIRRRKRVGIASADVFVELGCLVEPSLAMQFSGSLQKLFQGFRIQRRCCF